MVRKQKPFSLTGSNILAYLDLTNLSVKLERILNTKTKVKWTNIFIQEDKYQYFQVKINWIHLFLLSPKISLKCNKDVCV